MYSRTEAALAQGMERGWHIGAQLHVIRHGETVASLAMGEARRGAPMTTDTLMPWFSGTKAFTAVAVMQQWERGEVELDDPVRAHIPAFAGRGRDEVTIRHLLTHTAGLRAADGPAAARQAEPWDAALLQVLDVTPDPGWPPGRRAGYHLRGTFLLLGEIVRVVDGRPFDQYVREEVFVPAGMQDSWLSMPPDRYRAYGDRMGVMHATGGADPRPVRGLDDEHAYEHAMPSTSAVGPIGDLAAFYAALLDLRRPLLRGQTLEAMAARHRVGMVDETFGAKIDWGLGVMVNSWHYRRAPAPYGYGDHASMRAFGHGGSQSSIGFADPEHGLAVALVCNGMPGEAANHQRTQPVLTALYEDLGLPST
jgi:CubicO group peptidase (beta-lactamase class C family)